jgi:hypothetical protein
MKTTLLLFALVPNLFALDITTLDGKVYADCRISRVYPDSVCILYSGGGARVKFMNLPESLRTQYGFEPGRAEAFEKAEAAREQQERALVEAQRLQNQAQRNAAAAVPNQSVGGQVSAPAGNPGASYSGGALAGAVTANAFGGGFQRNGAQYVVVRMANPGGIYGITYGPTRPRP